MTERNDFNFRRLYESSQASLTDMAARQAEALSRLGRFRNAITLILKRNYPDMFMKAENATGSRLGDSDDEIIIAYLETFITSSKSHKKEQSLQPLKEALSSLGLNLQGDDVLAWVDYIHKLRMNGGKIVIPPHESILSREVDSKPSPIEQPLPIEDMFEDFSTLVDPIIDQNRTPSDDLLENMFTEPENTVNIDIEKAIPSNASLVGRWTPSPVSPSTNSTAHPREEGVVKDFEELVTKDPTNVANPQEVEKPKTVFHEPLRPQLFPSAPKGKRKNRYSRVQADKPDDLTYDVPSSKIQSSEDLTAELSNKLITSCAIARPVFIRDLVSIAGSRDLVEQWENDCRANPAKNPVRFIGAKLRHRDRGSLVIPATSLRIVNKDISKNWWWDAIESYRGAKLYELAVLLSVKVGDSLVSSKFMDNFAILRVNANTGLVAFVVIFTPKVDEPGPINKSFTDELKELGKERLTQIIVLTTIAEDKSIERVISAIDNLVSTEKWSPTCPVSVSYSWEFTDNRGSTAHLVVAPSI